MHSLFATDFRCKKREQPHRCASKNGESENTLCNKSKIKCPPSVFTGLKRNDKNFVRHRPRETRGCFSICWFPFLLPLCYSRSDGETDRDARQAASRRPPFCLPPKNRGHAKNSTTECPLLPRGLRVVSLELSGWCCRGGGNKRWAGASGCRCIHQTLPRSSP